MQAPKHLSKIGKRKWLKFREEYQISDEGGLAILTVAMEADDRARQDRELIDRDGLTMVDKAGQLKPHPLLANERDSRAAFLAALKMLNLDLEPLKGIGRPGGK
jgi:P27 family predicted phage terminase small subunit